MTLLDRRQCLLGAAAVFAARFTHAGALAAETSTNQALLDLLGMIPSGPIGDTALSKQTATFANIAGQLKAVEAQPPADLGDETALHVWTTAMRGMAGPESLQWALTPDWKTTFGFEVFDIDQSLEFGMPPLVLTAYRGRFMPDAIGAALKVSGYKPIDRADAAVWSLAEDATISFDNPANHLALSRMNNVAVIGTDVLLAAPRLDALKAMLDTVASKRPSMAANADLAALVKATTVDLASGLFVSGDSVAGAATPVKTVLAGITFGAAVPPEASTPVSAFARQSTVALAKMELTALTARKTDAVALSKSIDSGLRTKKSQVTQEPYTDFFSDWKIGLFEDDAIVTVELTFASGHAPASWSQFISQRDLGFLGVS